MLEQVVARHREHRAGLPDGEGVVAPRQLGDPAGARLDGPRVEPRQRLRHVGVVGRADRVAVVAGQRVAVGAAAVLEARQAGRRLAAQLVREASVGRLADRQRQAAEHGGLAAGGDHDALVLDDRPGGPDLAVGPDGDDLVAHQPVAERLDQRRYRRAGADHAAVLVDHRRAAPGREQRQALLGGVERARVDAGLDQERQPRLHGGPERDDPVGGQQLDAEAPLPGPPAGARLEREGDEPRVVVRVPEHARLAAGLAAAGSAALVDGHGGAPLGELVGGGQSDDPGADHGDVAHSAHGVRARSAPRSRARAARRRSG